MRLAEKMFRSRERRLGGIVSSELRAHNKMKSLPRGVVMATTVNEVSENRARGWNDVGNLDQSRHGAGGRGSAIFRLIAHRKETLYRLPEVPANLRLSAADFKGLVSASVVVDVDRIAPDQFSGDEARSTLLHPCGLCGAKEEHTALTREKGKKGKRSLAETIHRSHDSRFLIAF